MKKKLIKKLTLNKATIARLQDSEINLIKGGTVTFDTCDCDTASCSLQINCCGPTTTKEQYIIPVQDQG